MATNLGEYIGEVLDAEFRKFCKEHITRDTTYESGLARILDVAISNSLINDKAEVEANKEDVEWWVNLLNNYTKGMGNLYTADDTMAQTGKGGIKDYISFLFYKKGKAIKWGRVTQKDSFEVEKDAGGNIIGLKQNGKSIKENKAGAASASSSSSSTPPAPNWEKARNIILYGPPGTGKTYHTVIYAVAICEDRTVEDVVADAYSDVLGRYNNTYKDQIEFVTFHQSYGYEEFIQGIKPSTDKGNVVYNVEDGIFKKFCDEAKGKAEKYVFIIDEINRGNVSKIFGELITLIENSKRISASDPNKGMKATLPYEKVDENGNKVKVEFGVPDNVYILGTMNTADRSLVQLDAALRRRFRFKEMMPNYDVLDTDINGINLATLLKAINKRISARIDREHQIGHSYFLKVNSFEDLKETFRYEIIPLLQEYFYDDYANIKEILKDDKDNKFISVETVKDYENTKLYEIGDSAAWDEDAFKKIYE